MKSFDEHKNYPEQHHVGITFYCVFESVMQLPDFDWEEDRQHAGQWGGARYAVQDFAESYNLNEEDENRIAVLNRDTGEVSVWELTIRKEYDVTEVIA